LLSYDVIGLGKEAGGKEYNVGVIPDKTLRGGEPLQVEYLAAMDLPVRCGM